ncbi:MAG: rhodanese-like domain-containing protein [Gammaproteobacteria bacterium]
MDRYIEFVLNHWMLFIGLVVVTILLIQDLVESAFKKFSSISPLIAVTQMNADDTAIVDVREEHEFNKGHIENAINIPFGKFDENVVKLEAYKQSPLIVVCQSGTRSAPACKKLCKMGFEKVFNMTGGMQSWEDNKLPIKVKKK